MTTDPQLGPISPERWRSIGRLLERVLDVSPPEAVELLDRECAGDLLLRREVESLLAAEHTAPSFLEGGAAEFAAPAMNSLTEEDPAPADAKGGRHLGPWRLVEQIGQGGMSVVWLAERADGQFTKCVAIKLLRQPATEREEFARRFRIEREILASLEHPNIARVLDGGVSAEGTPYLVLEYVDGLPLARYCRERGLDVAQRLGLFADVCAAVQHAHQRLIVHRDLKPSNILVVPPAPGDSGCGTVKLLDFGIAKLLDEEESAVQPATRTGVMPMTPEYAAPEQILGGEITTATDVYALGVVLYELLTGERPYELAGSTAGEIERSICEKLPDRPSTVVRRLGHPSGRLPGTPSGDLDAIVLEALAKEPSRRYGSARELAEDLHRLREGLPVRARVPTRRYLVARFVRRHLVGVATATLFLLTLAAFALVIGLQQRATARERDLARAEAASARAVTDYLVDLFEAGDPAVARGAKLDAEQLLERGARRAASLDGEPLVRSRLLDAIARAYRNLGRPREAAPLLEQAVEILRTRPGGSEGDLALALNHLALVRRQLGEYHEARKLYEQSIELHERIGVPEEAAVVRANYGYLLLRLDELDQAEIQLRRALTEMERTRDPDDPKIADVLSKLAGLAYSQGRNQEAIPLARRALEMARRSLGRHPRTASLASNLAVMLRHTGDLDAADRLYAEALEIDREILGPRHPNVALTMSNRAQLLKVRGQNQAAAKMLRDALEITRESLGERNRRTAQILNNLAGTLGKTGEREEAERLAREALSIRRELFGGDHTDVAQSLMTLAGLVDERGATGEAVALLSEAHGIYARRGSPGGPHAVTAAIGLGRGLVRLGKRREARRLLEETVKAIGDRRASDDPQLRRLSALLAEIEGDPAWTMRPSSASAPGTTAAAPPQPGGS